MPVIAIASSKGGSGKSTAALILAGAYAADGYTVHIIDADRAARIKKWASVGAKPDNITVTEQGDPAKLRLEIDRARAASDIVIIDVEGTANMSLGVAVGFSDVVVIPANQSAPDVEEALRTASLVIDIAAAARRQIPYGLLWSRVSPAIKSREADSLAVQINENGIPVIGSVYDRTAYKSLFSFATTLDRLPPSEVPTLAKAQAEADIIAKAVIDLITTTHQKQEAAA